MAITPGELKGRTFKSLAAVSELNLTDVERQRLELLRCGLDPTWFINNYIWIRSQPDVDDDETDQADTEHEQRLTQASSIITLQKLWPKQEELVEALLVYHQVIAGKSRKIGFTTTGLGFGMWINHFHEASRCHLFSRRDDAAKNMLSRVKFSWRRLPGWMRLPAIVSNEHILTTKGPGVSDERTMQAYPTIEDSGIEETADYTMIDEFASIPEPKAGRIWAAIEPSIAPNGYLFILSRGKGPGGTFANLYRAALAAYGQAYERIDQIIEESLDG